MLNSVTPVLQADAPVVKDMAQRAIAGHEEPEARARAIVTGVHRDIRTKPGCVFRAAAQIAQNRGCIGRAATNTCPVRQVLFET